MRLSDSIEEFIKALMVSEEQAVELKRNELADYFHCAPSQINYVLSTRFTPDHGYVTESRRGGGGYIRIVRMVDTAENRLQWLLQQRIGDSISEEEARRILSQLREAEIVTDGEASLMFSAVSDRALCLPLPRDVKDAQRARILRSMLLNLSTRGC